MKITKARLKEIIREEMDKLMATGEITEKWAPTHTAKVGQFPNPRGEFGMSDKGRREKFRDEESGGRGFIPDEDLPTPPGKERAKHLATSSREELGLADAPSVKKAKKKAATTS